MLEMLPSLAAALFLLTVGVFQIIQKKSAPNIAFCATAFLLAAIEIADQALLRVPSGYIAVSWFRLFMESLLPFSFLFFSFVYARRAPLKSLSFKWKFLLVFSGVFPLSLLLFSLQDFFYVNDLLTRRILVLGTAGYWFYLGIMVYCIIAIVNLETVFSATAWSSRWKLKFEHIGITSILAVLIFYFSQGLLYRIINMNLIPLRSWIFIISSALIGYSRVKRGDTEIAVSRYIAYRSFALLIIGAYLLILGLAGEGMKYFGIAFGKNFLLLITFVSGILVMSVFLSEKIRRQIKIFVNKHFYAHKYDYRDEWLKFTERLASCTSIYGVLQMLLTTYRESFGLRGILLYLASEEEHTLNFAAGQEMDCPVRTINLSPQLRDYFVEKNRVLNPFDKESIPFREEVSFAVKAGARIAVPLVANGAVEGLVLFGEQIAPEEFTYEDYDLMKTLARQATLSIMNFRLSEELAGARELAAVSKISTFVIHDLKNHVYSLSLLLENAAAHMGNPEFQEDMLATIGNTVKKMNGLIQRLKAVPEKNMLNRRPADVSLLAKEVVEDLKKTKNGRYIMVRGTSAFHGIDTEEIKKVIANLLLNAFDATLEGGSISIETGTHDKTCYIRVSDEGCGIPEEFIRNHMFRPFKTTKAKGLGIGLYQCMQIVKAHDGHIDVQSEIGKGTVFTVVFPLPGNKRI